MASAKVKNCSDWAISLQAVPATGGRFDGQVIPTGGNRVQDDFLQYRPADENPRARRYSSMQAYLVDDMTWTVSKGTEVGVKFPGDNKSEFLQQIMDAGEELRMDEEAAAVSRNPAKDEVITAGSETGSLMAGAATWAMHNSSRGTGAANAVLDGTGTFPNKGGGPLTAPTAGTARAFTETLLRDTLRKGWNDGARFNLLMSTGDMIERIGEYMFTSSARIATLQSDVPQSNRTGVAAGNGARSGGIVAQGSVNMFVGNFGVVTLTPNRQMEAYPVGGAADRVDILFIDTRYPMIGTLHDYATKDLGVTGLYDQQVLYCDKTFIPGATRSLAVVADINPTLPVTA